jgi:uncharacterized protein YbbC (DUF1343 family)
MSVFFGVDSILQEPPAWKTARIGLVTNQAATTATGIPSRKALLDAGFGIQKLFSPEHGLEVTGADGHRMKDGTDTLTGLPVISLYNTKLAPDAADLAGLDYVVFDVPDVGSRFYTYLWTMTHVMEACAKARIPLVILDRPNPISGNLLLAEGPMLEEAQSSFIGRWPIPIRHSCTLGELAYYFNKNRQINVNLLVVKCRDWKRTDFLSDWHLPFIPTSPAIRSYESMLLYPGLCLLEATNLSEGRGTMQSFTAVGAPWLRHEELAGEINRLFAAEIRCETASFTPDNIHVKFHEKRCKAIIFNVIDPESFKPVFFGTILIRLLRDMHPAQFRWQPYITMVNPTGKNHLDKLLGITGAEALMDLPMQNFIATITRLTSCREWAQEIGPYLLYD